MKLWRSVKLEELLQILSVGKVTPRPFHPNSDSTCSLSKCSFWFTSAIVLKYADAVIEAEVDADKVALGMMRFSHTEDWPHAEIYREYEIEEAYIVDEVKPLRIWVSEYLLESFNLWDLDIDECESEYGFNPWELDENELKQNSLSFPNSLLSCLKNHSCL
ncbi:MAG: hypothetical protein J7L14_03700 [Candidatus Diapherotrites archaeon]|nr:hypothetical protein [Candidatus Diapherotrites archaeon]